MSGKGRETENGRERGIGTEELAEVTPTAAIPAEHQTGKGADHVIGGGPGAETRTGRGNANAAGTVAVKSGCVLLCHTAFLEGQG